MHDWCAETSGQLVGIDSQRLPFTLHEDYAPNWDYTCGGSKLLLTCSLNEMREASVPTAQLHVSFGGEQASRMFEKGHILPLQLPHNNTDNH